MARDHTAMEDMRLRLRFVAAVGVATRRVDQLADAADASLATGDHATARWHLLRAGMYDDHRNGLRNGLRRFDPQPVDSVAVPTPKMLEIKERVDEACRAAEARSAAELALEYAQVDAVYEQFIAETEASVAEVDVAYEQFLVEMEMEMEGGLVAVAAAAAANDDPEIDPALATAFEDFLDEFEDLLDEVEAADTDAMADAAPWGWM